MSDNAIQVSIWLLFITMLHINSTLIIIQVSLFAGKVNQSAATTVDVTLNPKLSGVTIVKVYSFPPGRCVKTTLWVCFDLVIEKESSRLGQHSVHPVGGIQQQISQDIPTSEEERQQQQHDGGGDFASSLQRIPSKLHRVSKRASGIAVSSATTPRTCKCV